MIDFDGYASLRLKSGKELSANRRWVGGAWSAAEARACAKKEN